MAEAKLTMDELLAGAPESAKRAVVGETVTGKILSMRKHEILIDLGARGVGVVPRREVSFARNLNVGDEVTASVIEAETADGSVLLSLRKAAKEKGWDEIQQRLDNAESVEVTPFDANRGGLLAEYEGIRGFLPVSQLSAEKLTQVSRSSGAALSCGALASRPPFLPQENSATAAAADRMTLNKVLISLTFWTSFLT